MTDTDIIKVLECCKMGNDCDSCEYEPTKYKKGTVGCCCNLMEDALNLINRQKAEIEVKNKLLDIAEEKFETIKADTMQEFIKRFEKKIKDVKFTIGQTWEIKSAIKEVVKEMAGETND